MSSTGATLSGSYSGASGEIHEAGIVWGTNSTLLDDPDTNESSLYWSYDDTCLGNNASGNMSCAITSLEPSTTYYYRAFVAEYNSTTQQYEYRYGSKCSFTTSAAPQSQTMPGWLELPATTGNEDYVGKFYGSGSTAGTNRNYSYSYSYTYYASMWVAYPLTSAHTSGSGGSENWAYNPNIAQNKQVSITDKSYPTVYGASAYARGHQCPNASRKSNSQMNNQTYYATNQTPQLQNKFNGSVWGALEGAVRGLTSSADTVYVVTGPLYRKAGGSETINYLTGASGQNANPSSLPIPNYYWKALLKVRRNGNGTVTAASAIGFWFDHREYNKDTENYYDAEHIVSVNQIETWTGLDLFVNLPGTNSSGVEADAESNASWSDFQSFSTTQTNSNAISPVTPNYWGTL